MMAINFQCSLYISHPYLFSKKISNKNLDLFVFCKRLHNRSLKQRFVTRLQDLYIRSWVGFVFVFVYIFKDIVSFDFRDLVWFRCRWDLWSDCEGDNDSVRVGGPTNILLNDGGLSTVISKPNGVTSDKGLTSGLEDRDP